MNRERYAAMHLAVGLVAGGLTGIFSTWFFSKGTDPWSAIHCISSSNSKFIGTCWSAGDNLYVTALHVPMDEPDVMIDGRCAEVVAIDKTNDLCVLRAYDINGSSLRVGHAHLGEQSMAMGYVGYSTGFGYRMQTHGRVSSVSLPDGFVGYDGGIQPGLSGSPVIGDDGRVVGVVSSAQKWGFAANGTMGRICAPWAVEKLLASIEPLSPALPMPSSKPVVTPPTLLGPFNLGPSDLFRFEFQFQPEEQCP